MAMATDVGEKGAVMTDKTTLSVESAQETEVLLINMPFSNLYTPSLGLSLLKASLAPLSISSKVQYFTLQFAEQVGSSIHLILGVGLPYPGFSFDFCENLIGEWLFAGALFGPDSLDTLGYIEHLRGRLQIQESNSTQTSSKKLTPETYIQHLLRARSKVEGFLEECVETTLSQRPKIVGFTSLYQQHVASLALAKRIKERSPETFIVFGGPNCERVMGAEMIRQFPFVDAVVSGEGELIFPELVQRVLANRSIAGMQGVYTRAEMGLKVMGGRYPNAPTIQKMDSLPYPDYQDFFEQWEKSSIDKRLAPALLFESSRGCWWGERNHCTFCGMNGGTMAYRSKSGPRALDELVYLTGKYPTRNVSVVDNILEMKYFKDFVPELTKRELGIELFYEVKANLKKEQVRQLRDAGITGIQPGIESLSSRVLDLMRKGVRSLQNIQLLKWCKEYGLHPCWNMLWGFPGEPQEEYARMAEIIPLLTHLSPPGGHGAIRLDRFSPNFEKAEQFGLVNVTPAPAYGYIYPLAPEAVTNLAYHFTFNYGTPQDVEGYTQPVAEQIEAWKAAYPQSELFSLDTGAALLICDLRPVASEQLTVLTALQRVLYLACDSAQNLGQLQQLIKQQFGESATAPEIEELLQPLLECGLMIREDNSYLSLAVPLGDYAPSKSGLERFNELIKPLGYDLVNADSDVASLPNVARCRSILCLADD
jgi:ribosomal peptide maturation radical SAM protein 1